MYPISLDSSKVIPIPLTRESLYSSTSFQGRNLLSAYGILLTSSIAIFIYSKSLYIFAIVAGIFYGIHVHALTPLLGDLFGRKTLGTLMGF